MSLSNRAPAPFSGYAPGRSFAPLGVPSPPASAASAASAALGRFLRPAAAGGAAAREAPAGPRTVIRVRGGGSGGSGGAGLHASNSSSSGSAARAFEAWLRNGDRRWSSRSRGVPWWNADARCPSPSHQDLFGGMYDIGDASAEAEGEFRELLCAGLRDGLVSGLCENRTRYSALYFDLDFLDHAQVPVERLVEVAAALRETVLLAAGPSEARSREWSRAASVIVATSPPQPHADSGMVKSGAHLIFPGIALDYEGMLRMAIGCRRAAEARFGPRLPPLNSWADVFDLGVYRSGLRMLFVDKAGECAQCRSKGGGGGGGAAPSSSSSSSPSCADPGCRRGRVPTRRPYRPVAYLVGETGLTDDAMLSRLRRDWPFALSAASIRRPALRRPLPEPPRFDGCGWFPTQEQLSDEFGDRMDRPLAAPSSAKAMIERAVAPGIAAAALLQPHRVHVLATDPRVSLLQSLVRAYDLSRFAALVVRYAQFSPATSTYSVYVDGPGCRACMNRRAAGGETREGETPSLRSEFLQTPSLRSEFLQTTAVARSEEARPKTPLGRAMDGTWTRGVAGGEGKGGTGSGNNAMGIGSHSRASVFFTVDPRHGVAQRCTSRGSDMSKRVTDKPCRTFRGPYRPLPDDPSLFRTLFRDVTVDASLPLVMDAGSVWIDAERVVSAEEGMRSMGILHPHAPSRPESRGAKGKGAAARRWSAGSGSANAAAASSSSSSAQPRMEEEGEEDEEGIAARRARNASVTSEEDAHRAPAPMMMMNHLPAPPLSSKPQTDAGPSWRGNYQSVRITSASHLRVAPSPPPESLVPASAPCPSANSFAPRPASRPASLGAQTSATPAQVLPYDGPFPSSWKKTLAPAPPKPSAPTPKPSAPPAPSKSARSKGNGEAAELEGTETPAKRSRPGHSHA